MILKKVPRKTRLADSVLKILLEPGSYKSASRTDVSSLSADVDPVLSKQTKKQFKLPTSPVPHSCIFNEKKLVSQPLPVSNQLFSVKVRKSLAAHVLSSPIRADKTTRARHPREMMQKTELGYQILDKNWTMNKSLKKRFKGLDISIKGSLITEIFNYIRSQSLQKHHLVRLGMVHKEEDYYALSWSSNNIPEEPGLRKVYKVHEMFDEAEAAEIKTLFQSTKSYNLEQDYCLIPSTVGLELEILLWKLNFYNSKQ